MANFSEPRDDGPEVVEAAPMMLLPPAPGLCRFCAVDHASYAPHNRDSLFYQMRFHQAHGRWPRWSDAVAHCGERTTMGCANMLRTAGVWTQEDDDAMNNNTAIAEPCE